MLLEFEERFGTRLPASYCSFIRLFGSGTLASEFNIFAPGRTGHLPFNLRTVNDRFRQADAEGYFERYYQNADQMRRLIFFGDNSFGGQFAWDTGDISEPSDSEYGVYFLDRESTQPLRLANSFRSFLTDVCLGGAYFGVYRRTGLSDRRRPRMSFMPAYSVPTTEKTSDEPAKRRSNK